MGGAAAGGGGGVEQGRGGGGGGREEDETLSGKLLYCRLVLGSQQQLSWVRKERRDGSAAFGQIFVFAVPLPIRNRCAALRQTFMCAALG